MFSLSIIIPSYNRASLLERTLHSLTLQSRTDFQVIIVDHGSSDDTAEVCYKYQNSIHLEYYKIPRDDCFAPSIPRNFGAARAIAPLIAFLDTGMIVPTTFVTAHINFHYLHTNTVGIGLQHGHLPLQSKQDKQVAAEALTSITDIDQAYPLLQALCLQDPREEVDLETTAFPWFFGWTANLSLPRVAYQKINGFDLTFKGWGIEDLEFCYRLYRQGLKFSWVQNGWGIELTQSRASRQERIKSSEENMLYCYFKHRSLALESLLFAKMDYLKAETAFRYLTTIEHDWNTPPANIAIHFTRPSLLIGGTEQDTHFYDYVTAGEESLASTSSVWSCSGVIIPLADQSLETIVVTDVWKKFGWSIYYFLGLHGIPLLEQLIIEIRRIAKRAVFVDSNAITLDTSKVSVVMLKELCQQYNLPYQILTL